MLVSDLSAFYQVFLCSLTISVFVTFTYAEIPTVTLSSDATGMSGATLAPPGHTDTLYQR